MNTEFSPLVAALIPNDSAWGGGGLHDTGEYGQTNGRDWKYFLWVL